MRFLVIASVVCALAAVADAACYVKPVKPGMRMWCEDNIDGTLHVSGSTWRNSACQDCNCRSCCDAYATPRSFPDDCVSVFDAQACKYNVHKKNDPSVECDIYAAVGK